MKILLNNSVKMVRKMKHEIDRHFQYKVVFCFFLNKYEKYRRFDMTTTAIYAHVINLAHYQITSWNEFDLKAKVKKKS